MYKPIHIHRFCVTIFFPLAASYFQIGFLSHLAADLLNRRGDIVGKYVGHIKGAGKVMDFISSSVGFLVVIVLPMLIFFIYQVYHLIMISIRLKKEVAIETAKEVELAKMKAREAAEAEMAKSSTDEEKQNEAVK